MKAILFDFADTLATGHPCWELPQVVACREQGLTVSPTEVKAAIWRVWRDREGCAHREASRDEASYSVWIGAIEAAILRELGLADGVEAAARRVMELQADPASYRVFHDVAPALAQLRAQGVRLAIVSNNGWWLPDLVAGLGLAEFFDAVITSARVGYRKPRPEIFAFALEAVGVAPSDALFVGDDYENDVRGAQAAGLGAVRVNRHGGVDHDPAAISNLEDLASRTDWLNPPP